MGAIMEKNALVEDSAKNYNSAWEILNKQDPAVGKRFVDSVLLKSVQTHNRSSLVSFFKCGVPVRSH